MKPLESRLRLATGLLLATYVVQHLLNHAFGIVSIENAEAFRKTVGALFQNPVGLVLLYGSFLFHASIALRSIYRRSSLRMPLWQWAQVLLGLAILPLLAGHAIGNRGYDLLGDVDPNYFYVVTSLLLKPVVLYKLVALILVVWLHMLIGLHFWLRLRQHYRHLLPYTYAAALLLPAMAYAGLFSMLREASAWLDDRERLDSIYAANLAMNRSDVAFLQGLEAKAWIAMAALLLLTLFARQLRIWIQARRGSYRVAHADGSEFRELNGVSLLEALRNAGIPHASVCGGRARCTTCRVRVGSGRDSLDPPNELEARALARIGAAADLRLACQLYPRGDLAVTPLVMPGQDLGTTLQRGGVHGHEEYVVAMFVDMRGSTNLGERVLAYDVVFILNRFFTELSASLDATRGHYAQFAGDGLMALYGLDPARKSRACRDALDGAAEMFRRLERLNRQLEVEFGERVQMGIGIHGGDAIVGTMGPPNTPLLTAVGDSINIAARLEAQTKTQGCDLLVSTSTLDRENLSPASGRQSEIELRGREGRVSVCALTSADLPLDFAG